VRENSALHTTKADAIPFSPPRDGDFTTLQNHFSNNPLQKSIPLRVDALTPLRSVKRDARCKIFGRILAHHLKESVPETSCSEMRTYSATFIQRVLAK
jgi:hypothetical protein